MRDGHQVCLSNMDSFETWTLEDVCDHLGQNGFTSSSTATLPSTWSQNAVGGTHTNCQNLSVDLPRRDASATFQVVPEEGGRSLRLSSDYSRDFVPVCFGVWYQSIGRSVQRVVMLQLTWGDAVHTLPADSR